MLQRQWQLAARISSAVEIEMKLRSELCMTMSVISIELWGHVSLLLNIHIAYLKIKIVEQ